MEWNEILIYIIESIVGLIIAAVIPYVITLIKKKIDNQQVNEYIDIAEGIVTDCVYMTKQTFVDSLKKEGKFDAEAQAKAFEMCKEQILSLLNEEAKKAVISVYGDLEGYLKAAIETNVAVSKA